MKTSPLFWEKDLMRLIEARNPHQALPKALKMLQDDGHLRKSRAGAVMTVDGPVTTTYERPWEMVVFQAQRDANPFFHLMEALWMLAGRDDLAFVRRFNRGIARFAEDEGYFHGAYGRRWRHHFGADQLPSIVRALREQPNCRRQILQMWDPLIDLNASKRDIPCNITVHFQVSFRKRLDMTVFCRSNDVVWGCYGSDCVTFGVLQQFVAAAVGVPPGRYFQVSDNFHAYTDTADFALADQAGEMCPYEWGSVVPTRLVDHGMDADDFIADVENFCSGGTTKSWFLQRVAEPMARAYDRFRGMRNHPERYDLALEELSYGACHSDWIVAAKEWFERRQQCRA